jgi:hypothetical protein
MINSDTNMKLAQVVNEQQKTEQERNNDIPH